MKGLSKKVIYGHCWYNSKNLCEYYWVFSCDFWIQDKHSVESYNENMYNGNIGYFDTTKYG